MIIVSRAFSKEELEGQPTTMIGTMYQKVVKDASNEQLTQTELCLGKERPFIKDVIISILKGSRVIADNRYWQSVALQVNNILTQNKSLSYLDAKANPAMFVWGFRLCADEVEFWCGSNLDEQQLMDENKSFKDILTIQGIELFPGDVDDKVITHTFSATGIQWNESWVEHRYRNDKDWVVDLLLKHADLITPEFIYGDYSNIDIPFNKHKYCLPGTDKILYTVLNCMRVESECSDKLKDLLLDIHRSYLERVERQARFMEYIRSCGLQRYFED